MVLPFQAAEECTSVLELDYEHSGALMLRAQTLVTLKEYNSALFDVNRLLEMDPSSEVYQNLQARLRTQLVGHYFSHYVFTIAVKWIAQLATCYSKVLTFDI